MNQHKHEWERQRNRDAWHCLICRQEVTGFDLHVMAPRRLAASTPKEDENETIVELRTKLEVRTWFLRASLALNTGVVAGLVARVLA